MRRKAGAGYDFLVNLDGEAAADDKLPQQIGNAAGFGDLDGFAIDQDFHRGTSRTITENSVQERSTTSPSRATMHFICEPRALMISRDFWRIDSIDWSL